MKFYFTYSSSGTAYEGGCPAGIQQGRHIDTSHRK